MLYFSLVELHDIDIFKRLLYNTIVEFHEKRVKMTVTFFGHRQIQGAEDLKGELKRSIEDLIGKGEENITFLCGGYGAFDGLCASLLRELKKKHLHLEMVFVTPYISEAQQKKLQFLLESREYDSIVYPPLEKVPPRLAILKRNEWMVESADVIIAYVNCNYGGAYKAVSYAMRKKKRVINLAQSI